jgi:hypothetical protein
VSKAEKEGVRRESGKSEGNERVRGRMSASLRVRLSMRSSSVMSAAVSQVRISLCYSRLATGKIS